MNKAHKRKLLERKLKEDEDQKSLDLFDEKDE